MQALGISKAFTGIVIVGIAGNAVENVVGISLAAKGKSDLAVSVVKNSVAQIACFLFPALVLLSLFFTDRLTFVLNPVYVGALAVTAVAVWQITGDGEAFAYEGLALVGMYVVLATVDVLRVAASRLQSPTSRRRPATSSRVNGREAPGASSAAVSPAYRLRCRRRTGWPTASHIRFTWCLRPSWIVSSMRPRPSRRARAGAVRAVLQLDALGEPAERVAAGGSPSTSASYTLSTS